MCKTPNVVKSVIVKHEQELHFRVLVLALRNPALTIAIRRSCGRHALQDKKLFVLQADSLVDAGLHLGVRLTSKYTWAHLLPQPADL